MAYAYIGPYGSEKLLLTFGGGNDGILSLLHFLQTGSGAHPASYPRGKVKVVPVFN
jgi:hypothetical protein